jgi:hypothetical protein
LPLSSIEQTADIQPVEDAAVFAVGEVIGKTFSIFGRHFWKFALVAGVIMLPDLILMLINHDYAMSQYATASKARGSAGSSALSFVASILQTIAEAAVLRAAYADISGQAFDISAAVRQAFGRSRSLMGIVVVKGIGIGLGLVLLIVPGLMLFSMWYVAEVACMVEDIDAMPSLKRSTILTRDNRWKILGIGLVTVIVLVAIQLFIGQLALQIGGPVVSAFFAYGFQVIYLPFTATLSAVIYYDLRAAKEGLGIERISAVFD